MSIEPHAFVPGDQLQGACAACGNLFVSPVHVVDGQSRAQMIREASAPTAAPPREPEKKTLDRDYVGTRVMEQSQALSDGYKRNITDGAFSSNEKNEACATAASNTGWFILKALGFSQEEIDALALAYRAEITPPAESPQDQRDYDHG